ncbi:MAG: hypothetical protein RI907_2143, partial [Pseudomonadota bacterium]
MSATAPQAATSSMVRHYAPPSDLGERIMAGVLRQALKVTMKPFLGPPWPFAVQRAAIHNGSLLMPQDGRAQVKADRIDHIPVERVSPKGAAGTPRHAILYLHGGAFVSGSPRSHRSVTRRLSALTGAQVLVPHYRLAPEHPFPAQLEDCVRCYRQLLAEGYSADRIAIAGDSAGGNLTMMTAIAAMREGLPAPASLVMMSPAFTLRPPADNSHLERMDRDPMIRIAWGEIVEKVLKVPHDHPLADPMAQDLSRLPPSLTQVGDDEVLYTNAIW